VTGCGAFHGGSIGLHDHEQGTGVLFDLPHRLVMVVVSVADENDLSIGKVEAQLVNVVPNDRQILEETRIDQDVPARGFNEINGQIRGAYVLQVVCDFECGEWRMPGGVLGADDGGHESNR